MARRKCGRSDSSSTPRRTRSTSRACATQRRRSGATSNATGGWRWSSTTSCRRGSREPWRSAASPRCSRMCNPSARSRERRPGSSASGHDESSPTGSRKGPRPRARSRVDTHVPSLGCRRTDLIERTPVVLDEPIDEPRRPSALPSPRSLAVPRTAPSRRPTPRAGLSETSGADQAESLGLGISTTPGSGPRAARGWHPIPGVTAPSAFRRPPLLTNGLHCLLHEYGTMR